MDLNTPYATLVIGPQPVPFRWHGLLTCMSFISVNRTLVSLCGTVSVKRRRSSWSCVPPIYITRKTWGHSAALELLGTLLLNYLHLYPQILSTNDASNTMGVIGCPSQLTSFIYFFLSTILFCNSFLIQSTCTVIFPRRSLYSYLSIECMTYNQQNHATYEI